MANIKQGGEESPSSRFSKERLLKSARYSGKRDLLAALLEDGKEYSHDEVEQIVDKFMKGKVK
jgi:hypothetical protein